MALARESYLPLPLVAQMMGMSREHIARMIEDGSVVGFDVGLGKRRKWLIRRQDVHDFLASRSSLHKPPD